MRNSISWVIIAGFVMACLFFLRWVATIYP